MTAAIEGGEWSATRPGRTLPPGNTRYPFYRSLGGSQGRSGRVEILIRTGIRPRTVQPIAQSLYRLSYRAHNRIEVYIVTGTINCSAQYSYCGGESTRRIWIMLSPICTVFWNGAGLPPNLISTNTTGKGSCSVSLGSFMLQPIRLLIW